MYSIYIDGNGLSVRSGEETEWETAREMAREARRAYLLEAGNFELDSVENQEPS